MTSTSSKPFLDISTHALRRATPKTGRMYVPDIFQLTEGNSPASRCVFPAFIFQLTPSQRATMSRNLPLLLRHFNSRPHRGRHVPYIKNHQYSHFNSRPHRGRRLSTGRYTERDSISTHALTEGDIQNKCNRLIFCISTHALTEGDT